MRIITLVKNYSGYFVLLFFFFGFNSAVYSQCPAVNPNQSFCDTESPKISSLVATDNGGGVRWFSNSIGGSPLAASTVLNNGVTYYADDIAQTCSPRKAVNVTIYTKPISLGPGTSLCGSPTAADLAPYMVGNQIKWYYTPTGGTALNSAIPLVNGTTYFASQTNPVTTCETSRKSFTIEIKPISPIPTIGSNPQNFCSSPPPTIADLQVNGTSVSWYPTSDSGISLDSTAFLLDGQSYFAESNQVIGCPSSRVELFVNVHEPGNAGIGDSKGICVDQVAATTPFDLFGLLKGNPDNTGGWTGPITTTNGYRGTLDVSSMTLAGSPYTFTYRVSSASCPPVSSTVIINILPLPTVTVSSPTVCSGNTATMTATPNPAGTYSYVWTVPAGVTNPGNVSGFATTVAGTYSVIATNTNTNCPSTNSSGTVTINPTPTVTVNSPVICPGNSATVTATPNPAGTYSYVWTVPAGVTNPGNVSGFTTTVAGTYSVIATNTNTNCPSTNSSGTVTINPTPTVTVNSPAICPGNVATITATPNPAGTYSYVWTVPAGVTNPGNVSGFTTTVAGTYSVIATNTNTNCPSANSSGTVTINPTPTVTVNSPTICSGNTATMTATPNPAGTYSYVWTVPAGVTNPGNVSGFTTTVAGTYSVIATNTNTNCPSTNSSGTVTINPTPTVTVNSPVICPGNSATMTATPNPAGTYSYVWTVPAGVTNPGNVSGFTTTVAGTYSVIATNTNTNCPSTTSSGTVTINPTPTVTVNSPAICPGNVATVTATPNPAGTYSYVWTVPAGVTNPGNVSGFTTTVAGTYNVIATNTNTNCPSTNSSGTVIINLPPTVTVNSPTICSGNTATMTATPNPAGTYSYVWTVPAGVTNPGNVSGFTTAVAGTYSVIATNTNTNCPSTNSSGTVTINPTPTVTVNSPAICPGDVATVTATPNPAGTYSYVWTVPAGVTNPGNVSGFTTTVAGTYSVIATNTNTNCPSTNSSGTVTINPTPTVMVNSPAICPGNVATVTATPNPAGTYSYVWTVPAGVTNPGNVSSFTTTVAGTYSVIATNTNTNCPSANSSGTVIINPTPTVTVNSPTICSGNTATMTATPNPAGTYSYVWTVPAGVTNPGNVSGFTTTVAGTYSVIATNTNTNCPSTNSSGTVTINPTPTVTVNSPAICPGDVATVTATPNPAGTYSYVWTVPAGVTNPGNVSGFTTTVAGTYNVIAINTNTNCPSTNSSGTVTINPTPTVTVNSPAICPGDVATITATPNPAGTYSYVWTVPAGVTNPGNVSSFTTTVAGTYSVIATNTNTNCPSTNSSGTVTINPTPTVTVNSPTICSGNTATVTATPNPAGTYSYVWMVPAGVTNPGNVSGFTTTVAGTYNVIATNTNTNCPSSNSSGTLTINPTPTVTVNSPSICPGDVATVTATPNPAGTYSYVWTVPAGVTNPGNVSGFTTTVAGTYNVIATNTNTNCPSTNSSGTVTINPTPMVTVNSPTICSGSIAMVTAAPNPTGTYSYVWTVPAGVTNPGNVSSFTTAVAGTYNVIATNTNTNCPSSSASGTVNINPTPTVMVNSPVICPGDVVTLTATPNPAGTYSYVWTVPAGVTNPGNVSSFTTAVVGTYSVIATNTNTNCPSTNSSGTVTINPTPTVTVNSPAICPGDVASVTATPNPGGTYSYVWTVPAGLTNPGNVSSFTTTVAGTYNVLATNANTNCPSTNSSGTVTINPTPTVTINSPAICPGDSATVTASPNSAGTYSYVWTVPPGVVNPGNVASFTATVVGNYSVVITDAATHCSSATATGILSLNPTPTVMVNSPTICSGNTATITATPNPPGTYSYVWTVPAGVANPGNVSGFTTAVAGTYSVIASDTNTNCPSNSASGTLTVTPLPTVTVNNPSICSGDSATVTATPNPAGTYTYVWTVPSGVTNPGNVSSFTTTVAGIYSVAATNTTTTCLSSNAQGVVTVNPLPTVTVNSPIICTGSVATITAAPDLSGTYTYVWTVPSGVTNPGNVASFTTTTAGIYDVVITDSGTNCSSLTAPGTVTIKPVPYAGTDNVLSICSNQNAVDLFASLGTLQTDGTWSPALASGTGIFNPAVDVPGIYTYTIKGIAPCVDDSATITITITPGPEAGNNNTLNVCFNSTPQNLFPLLGSNAQSGGTWSPALASGTDLFNPAVDPQGAYTYSFTGPQSCDNDSAIITVKVNPVPNAGSDGSKTFCSNGSPEDLFPLLGVNAQLGGIWTTALASGTGVFDPKVDMAQAYTYTVGGGLCTMATAKVDVAVVLAPSSGGTAIPLNTCPSVTALDLFTALDGTQGAGTWHDDATGALVNNIFNPSLVAMGTYHFTYTVLGSLPCASSSTTVTVNVNPMPKAGIFAPVAPLCTSVGSIDLNTLLSNEDAGGIWTDSNSQIVTSPISIANFNAGPYSYTYKVTNACGADTEVVQFTVLPKPELTKSNIAVLPVCTTANAVVNFNGIPDGTYTMNYDLSGSNSLASQPVIVTIASGIGSFTVPGTSIPNAGITIVTFTNIIDNATTCSNALTNVTVQLIVNSPANIVDSNLGIPAVCFGNNVTVNIANAVNLPDGTYQFAYTIPTGTPTSGNSGDVTIALGAGQFTIPASVFGTADNYTLTISGITTTTGCANPNVNASASFSINSVPNVTGAFVSAQPTCANSANLVTVSGASNLPDGDYSITCQLTGANISAAAIVTVTFISGAATFTIPATDLTNSGDTTIEINQLSSATTTCGVSGTVFSPFTFSVTTLSAPQLISEGNVFCENSNPTIVNLSENTVGTPSVLWYNSATGGTVYSDTDLLIDDATYYGALINSGGCESSVRLEVKVSLTDCSGVVVPDGFSPNNDGVNDTFEINSLSSLYPNFKLEVYNRYGNLIYEGDKNTADWDGTTTVGGVKLGNNTLPNGVYFYILNFNDGTKKPIQGRVYLNR